jgi:Glycosyl transferase family 90
VRELREDDQRAQRIAAAAMDTATVFLSPTAIMRYWQQLFVRYAALMKYKVGLPDVRRWERR